MKTNVTAGWPGLSYTAKDLEDIARHLDQLAEKEQQLSNAQLMTLKDRRWHLGQAVAYQDAARVLRATTLEPDGLLKRIADALGTGETGDALVQVARNAHTAEQELAALRRSA